MSDEKHAGESPFRGLDSKLTVFALANGMDLSKGEDYRRLEWFSDGLERGILIRCGEAEAFDVVIMAWKSRAPDERTESDAHTGVPLDAISAALTSSIDSANGLGAPG